MLKRKAASGNERENFVTEVQYSTEVVDNSRQLPLYVCPEWAATWW